MRTQILHRDQYSEVVAVYIKNTLSYTRTYLFDSEGYVEKTITVYADGTIDTH